MAWASLVISSLVKSAKGRSIFLAKIYVIKGRPFIAQIDGGVRTLLFLLSNI